MLRYALGRIGVAVLTVLTVTLIGFSLLRLSGDLAAHLAGVGATDSEIAETARLYGLDRPLLTQYLHWLFALLRGNLGASIYTHEPLLDIIANALPVTLILAFFGLALNVSIAVPLGTLAAIRAQTWIDRAVLSLAVLIAAMPGFWFALLLIDVFSVQLEWTPVSGQDSWRHFILPVIVVGLSSFTPKLRMTRAAMIEALGSDYVRTARAMGLRGTSVVFRHALRNAILPLVAVIVVQFGHMLGRTVITEAIFALNGLGGEIFRAVQQQDFPVVQTIMVFMCFVYLALTVLADLVSARLDPRIRLT